MDGITAGVIGELTPWSLLLLVVLFFMLGWIRPRSALAEIRAFYEGRITELREDGTRWREAFYESERVRETQRETIREALELAKVAEDALRSARMAHTLAEQETRHTGRVDGG